MGIIINHYKGPYFWNSGLIFRHGLAHVSRWFDFSQWYQTQVFPVKPKMQAPKVQGLWMFSFSSSIVDMFLGAFIVFAI